MSASLETTITQAIESAIETQQQWWALVPTERFRAIRRLAAIIADRHHELASAVVRPATIAEILASEVLPLADACRFAGKQGPRILAPRRLSGFAGAWWMGRIGVSEFREPWGIVLVIAPSNYPLLLPAVQIVHAIAAGNGVLVKPSPGCEKVLEVFRSCLVGSGIPESLVQLLPSEVAAAEIVLRLGVDKVVLTGSATTGRAVLHQLAESLTPSTMELSGCDAVFVHPQADLTRVAKSIAYALTMNAGATCIAPRRIFVTKSNVELLTRLLVSELSHRPAVAIKPQVVQQLKVLVEEALQHGARIVVGQNADSLGNSMHPTVLSNVRAEMAVAQADLFAPLTSLISVEDLTEAIELDAACPYHLGASVFGPEPHASTWATRINAGCVTVNDILVPTADPRVSFGGRGKSGWGSTRGAEGLLDMSQLKVVCRRRGRWMPHLDPKLSNDPNVLASLLKLFHSKSIFERIRSLFCIIRSGK